MEKQGLQIFFCTVFVALLLLSVSRLATCAEVEDEREFTYDKNDSVRGPDHWGEIREEWRICNSGRMQSPIDIMDKTVEIVSNLGRLNTDYKPSNATIRNRGHDIMVRWENDAGNIYINGTQYQLKQLHWHTPSEHTLNGKRFDMELHLVHESADGKEAVVGILYKIGRPDSFLKTIESHLEALAKTKEEERAIGILNPPKIDIGSGKYYRYIGSLTTPPCTENVVWTIVKEVRTVTREQLKLIRDAVHDGSKTNARPIQPTNQRPVKLYRPYDKEEN